MSRANTWLNLASAAYLALIVLLLAWTIWLAPPRPELISLTLLILLGPLLLALRGVLRGRRYTLAWSTLLILFYFVHGVVAMAGGGRGIWLGGAEVVLSMGYFAAAIAYVRASNPDRQKSGSAD